MGAQDVLYAWRDFECSFFAGALLCPRIPFRRFLIREAHSVTACHKVGVTPALVMRRMTAVSPYRHWHFFDAYPPGYLRAVYRGNGIPLPWGNMSLVSDPCPRWAVFRLLQTPDAPSVQTPKSQISVMQDGKRARLYCCHSLLTRDALDELHVLSVGVDLLPALDAQGFDGEDIVAAVAESCRRGGGDGAIPAGIHRDSRSVAGAEYFLDRGCARSQGERHMSAQRRLSAASPNLRISSSVLLGQGVNPDTALLPPLPPPPPLGSQSLVGVFRDHRRTMRTSRHFAGSHAPRYGAKFIVSLCQPVVRPHGSSSVPCPRSFGSRARHPHSRHQRDHRNARVE